MIWEYFKQKFGSNESVQKTSCFSKECSMFSLSRRWKLKNGREKLFSRSFRFKSFGRAQTLTAIRQASTVTFNCSLLWCIVGSVSAEKEYLILLKISTLAMERIIFIQNSKGLLVQYAIRSKKSSE